MSQRKFISQSIVELEALFASSSNNKQILDNILGELNHRKTGRSKKLKQAIEETIRLKSRNEEKVTSVREREEAPRSRTGSPPSTPTISCQPTKTAAPPIEMPSAVRKSEFSANTKTVSEEPSIVTDWDAEIANSNDSTAPNLKASSASCIPVQNTLDTWIALEALSSQSYKKERDLVIGNGAVIPLSRGGEPWTLGLQSIPNHQLYFHVYLGAIKLDCATEALLKTFGDDCPEKIASSGFASLGVIVVDRSGKLLSEESIAISSFGWTYGQMLNGQIDNVRHWSRAEYIIKRKLLKILSVEDEDGQSIPISEAQIQQAHQWMVNSYDVPIDHVEAPHFAIKILHRFGLDDPAPPLLNSFYIEDLQRAKDSIAAKSSGDALQAYLKAAPTIETIDLLKDQSAIDLLLSPKLTPVGRWPSNGRHSLVLLQQLAVNLAHSELKESGIASVNGPPGTGKTTLLRDVVAMNVVNRAKALCQFDNPESAFSHRGSTRIGQAHVHFYELDGRVQGHEILVASSNNKAVENISKELPLMDAIDQTLPPPRYFQTTSDNLAGTVDSTWGLAAAVMGNSANRSDFKNKALWDKNAGLFSYFKAIVSGSLSIDDVDGIPDVLKQEDPPTDQAAALQRWRTRQKAFWTAYLKAEQSLEIAQKAKNDLDSLATLEKEILKGKASYQEMTSTLQLRKNGLTASETMRNELSNNVESAEKDETSHLAQRPSFFSRLFQTQTWKSWKSASKKICSEAMRNRKLLRECEQDLSLKRQSYRQFLSQCTAFKNKLDSKVLKLDESIKRIHQASSVTGNRLIGPSFWGLTHAERQTHIPNLSDETQRLRDLVFKEAFEVHKAFLDAAAKPMRHNLMALFSNLSGRSLKNGKEAVLPSLWSSLFLLVPVISSTFASIGRMMGNVPNQSIGWLLIDEAGQATPQAAVGAIMRSKRAFIVGDPFQIEPVVTLPLSLVEKLADKFGVEAKDWCAPFTSTQSLADRASKYGAIIQSDVGELVIGSPLLVHRRCEEPMFSISNELAYGGQMVKATPDKPSSIRDAAGASRWIDVSGDANEKWCPQEGEVVIDLVKSIAEALGHIPDIFIVSPFRIVAERMRSRFRQEKAFFSAYKEDSYLWIKKRVGTVHTFQGKEAEAVILILGAPLPSQKGARHWATATVNLINVSVSRAKQAIYVIGNRKKWGPTGHASVLNGRL